MSKTTDGNIIEFLLGEKSFEGNWFGDRNPKDAGSLWWRKYLRRYIESLKKEKEGDIEVAYDYAKQKQKIFTEEGQVMFLKIRDAVHDLLKMSGAVRMDKIMGAPGLTGETWDMIACVDRLVELGEIREITVDAMGQYRIFTTTKYNT